jgi:transposase
LDLIQNACWRRRPAGMSKKTLSLDLRARVVAAVTGGISRRQAAARFGVSAASAIRWCERERRTGSPASYKRGGDRWSARIDAHKALILSLVDATCDITLKELQAQLAERGHHFSVGSLWRFFTRHKITWKKRPLMRASRIARTS